MKYYVMVKGASGSASFTVEPVTAKMTVRDVRDAIKSMIWDLNKMLVLDGIQPIIEISEASRNMHDKKENHA
jgi:hypothetical protein